MSPKPKDPYAVELDEQDERKLVTWLCDEVQGALDARAALIGEDGQIDYLHEMYRQASHGERSTPWPGAADLGSYIPTEKVDSMVARIMQPFYTEPLWTVEGWGESAQRAPLVEEFHQWKQESKDERFQSYLHKAVLTSLIETTGVLEISERSERRVNRATKRVAVATESEGPLAGAMRLDAKLKPELAKDESGNFVPGTPNAPAVEAVVDETVISRGPRYRIVSVRDFVMCPGHASDREDVYAYGKRFWRRWSVLQQREKDGTYQNIDQLSDTSDRDHSPLDKEGLAVAAQSAEHGTNEKELWEVVFLKDLDGDGAEEWYLATFSLVHQVLLRLRRDDLGPARFHLIQPFPRADSVWGYGYLQHKLYTISEEHTAIRNMIADRSALATAAPIKRMQGALWDPYEQAWGPREVIDVRDMREIEPVTVPDVPMSAINREQMVIQASERVAGLNDMSAVGVQSSEDRTLGENRMAAAGSEIRINLNVKTIQETLEEIGSVRHQLWLRALRAEAQGIEPPQSMVDSLGSRGPEAAGLLNQGQKITADLLEGNFRFKPRGSVENADPIRMRQDLNQFLGQLAQLAGAVPAIQGWLSHPAVTRALLAHMVRIYRIPDRQAMLGTLTEILTQQAQMQQMQAQAAMVPGMPGQPMPPGAPAPSMPSTAPPGGPPNPLVAMLQSGVPLG